MTLWWVLTLFFLMWKETFITRCTEATLLSSSVVFYAMKMKTFAFSILSLFSFLDWYKRPTLLVSSSSAGQQWESRDSNTVLWLARHDADSRSRDYNTVLWLVGCDAELGLWCCQRCVTVRPGPVMSWLGTDGYLGEEILITEHHQPSPVSNILNLNI